MKRCLLPLLGMFVVACSSAPKHASKSPEPPPAAKEAPRETAKPPAKAADPVPSAKDGASRPSVASPVAATPAKAPEPPVAVPAKTGEGELQVGVKAYEDGDYAQSASALKAALSLRLARRTDQVTAYKYLAFIACAGGEREACRGHFRKALAVDPKFVLSATEAGHPTWGPEFAAARREAQIERAKARASAPK